MTLTVLCGDGHINTYNLTTIEALHKVNINSDGETIIREWDWDFWRCPTQGCRHKEYASHVIDERWIEYKGEETPTTKTLLASLLILSFMLSIKNQFNI